MATGEATNSFIDNDCRYTSEMTTQFSSRIDRVQRIHQALSDNAPDPSMSTALSDSTGSVSLRAPGDEPTLPLGRALLERRSRYVFGSLRHLELSTLLRWALGPQRTVTTGERTAHTLDIHPSAGGLNSMTVHVVALEPIDDIASAIYTFDPARHRLIQRRTGDIRTAFGECLVQAEFAQRASVCLVLAGEMTATLVKYSERHYRTVHVDAGVAAAHLYLVGEALELSCCAISGFYDDRVADVLSLDDTQIPLLAFAVGARRELGEQR